MSSETTIRYKMSGSQVIGDESSAVYLQVLTIIIDYWQGLTRLPQAPEV